MSVVPEWRLARLLLSLRQTSLPNTRPVLNPQETNSRRLTEKSTFTSKIVPMRLRRTRVEPELYLAYAGRPTIGAESAVFHTARASLRQNSH